MNRFYNCFMPCVIGILGKKGAHLGKAGIIPNMFSLSSFSKGNIMTRRIAGNAVRAPMIHRSRIMGGF